jgi:hypothetical protein
VAGIADIASHERNSYIVSASDLEIDHRLLLGFTISLISSSFSFTTYRVREHARSRRSLVHKRIQAIQFGGMWSTGLVQVRGLGSALCSVM